VLRRLFGLPKTAAETPPLSTLAEIATSFAPLCADVEGDWSYTTLAESAQREPLLHYLHAHRWTDVAQIQAFDATADNVVVYLLRKGTTPLAVAVFLDPYEPYGNPELLQPAIFLDERERGEIAALSPHSWTLVAVTA
jgi:hypothetical protein